MCWFYRMFVLYRNCIRIVSVLQSHCLFIGLVLWLFGERCCTRLVSEMRSNCSRIAIVRYSHCFRICIAFDFACVVYSSCIQCCSRTVSALYSSCIGLVSVLHSCFCCVWIVLCWFCSCIVRVLHSFCNGCVFVVQCFGVVFVSYRAYTSISIAIVLRKYYIRRRSVVPSSRCIRVVFV